MYNHQLDAFIKAAEMGSFGKAADSLYISTPALIQQINLLEKKCNAVLFVRSNHGAKLTPAGQALYEDAITIIKLSQDALEKVRRIAETSESTVRIGTSLLFKCRLFPDIWSKVSSLCPNLKIEILPISEHENRDNLFSDLGIRYDIIECVFGTTAYKGQCNFLELMKTPFCCAVSKDHRLAQTKKLSLDDLNGEYLVMPVEGVSKELDSFRKAVKQQYPTIQIIDSPYYGVDTFALCEVNPYILITQQVYADIHPNLITIPLETSYTMPYGLMYANAPTPATKEFIEAIKTQNQAKRRIYHL